LGLRGFGSQLALVTALGSNVVVGKRESLRCSALYIHGGSTAIAHTKGGNPTMELQRCLGVQAERMVSEMLATGGSRTTNDLTTLVRIGVNGMGPK
jgi:hypothetical protein